MPENKSVSCDYCGCTHRTHRGCLGHCCVAMQEAIDAANLAWLGEHHPNDPRVVDVDALRSGTFGQDQSKGSA